MGTHLRSAKPHTGNTSIKFPSLITGRCTCLTLRGCRSYGNRFKCRDIGRSESSATLSHYIHFFPLNSIYSHKESLSDSFAFLDLHSLIRDILHLYFNFILRTAVILIDHAERMRTYKGFFSRKGRAGNNEEGISLWHLHNYVPRY